MKVEKRGEGEPEITVLGSVHGDEPAGKKAIERILSEDLDYERPVQFIVANEEALEKGRRFLETDLNRSFPGSEESNSREERLAHELLEQVEDTKVLDIHTTHSYPEPFATLKNLDEETLELVRAAGVDRAVYFPLESNTLTEYVERSVIVEAGRQGTEEAVDNAVEVIRNFLAYHGVIDSDYEVSDPELFQYQDTVDGDWEFTAENFEVVEEGETFAVRKGETLEADEPFYPVLMSTQGYEGMLGFKAKKLDK
ncbi:MAG: succinylglutamate desuccinylase/aspartoacylase family protein [Candidatus Nanohaloarchaeota archaeon QJJ-7]|nr:succinylglutamate desuccinylase/aspartoacylase family protein [Candidatus Nanohaloarchaeota archaeon QJJ-7]